MSSYIQKSKDNLAAADCLVGGDLYEASAHSAYYSIFLLSKALLNAHFGIGYDKQNAEFKGPKSHQHFFNLFAKCLNTEPGFEANDFLQWFNQTNMLRNKADYKPIALSKSLFEKNVSYAHSFSEGVIQFFKMH